MLRFFLNLSGIALTLAAWVWLTTAPLSGTQNIAIAVLGTLAVIPLVLVGRRLLDREPTIDRAHLVTTGVHYLVAFFFGSAILVAVRYSMMMPGLTLPLPSGLGLALIFISSVLLVAVIANLVLKGMGAPFAVALTRLVAMEWFYAWTRNPMILAALTLLVGLGLYLQSGLFLLWLLLLVVPVVLIFVKVYEERELEIRFGQSYLDYKARTPGFIPRRPQ